MSTNFAWASSAVIESSAQYWVMSAFSWFDVSSVMNRCTPLAISVRILDRLQRLLHAGVRRRHVDVAAHRHRALGVVEGHLDRGADQQRRETLLRRFLVRVLQLREHDHVAVGADDRVVFVKPDHAAEVLHAGHAGRGELAARPVAHDLQSGLAGDHEVGRVVPVAVGVAVVGVLLELLQLGQHLLHAVAAGDVEILVADTSGRASRCRACRA